MARTHRSFGRALRRLGVVAAASAALLIGSFSATGAVANETEGDVGANIVGGGPATEEYPFMAALLSGGRQICGATLVSDRWLVTAAHCTGGSMSVRLGSHNRSSGGEVVPVSQYINHPSYNGGNHDIALLELSRSVSFEPAQMASSAPGSGTGVRLLGWGQTCPQRGCDGGSETLKELNTSVLASSNCQTWGQGDLCIDGSTSQTACYGDSGGPALQSTGSGWVLVGDTSRAGDYNSTCGTGNVIYTSVADHRDWIDQYVDGSDPGPGPGGCEDRSNGENGSLSNGQTAVHPDGSYFQAGAGSHSGCLKGPDGTDFDLHLQRWNGSYWQTVASGTTPQSEETVSYDGSAGYYRWIAESYSGSGSYSIGWDQP
ncbi:S1 family peptidase [Salininema proteolyticum]|uniref:S1 family peptidase n=1 Tax=Salininema proteolyticum TaxID=1607685 RepID=A0ABV8U0F6_9ACTN